VHHAVAVAVGDALEELVHQVLDGMGPVVRRRGGEGGKEKERKRKGFFLVSFLKRGRKKRKREKKKKKLKNFFLPERMRGPLPVPVHPLLEVRLQELKHQVEHGLGVLLDVLDAEQPGEKRGKEKKRKRRKKFSGFR